jgi:hypothetical protein
MKALLVAASALYLAACDFGSSRLLTGPTALPRPPVEAPVAGPRTDGPTRVNPTPLAPGSTVDVTVLQDDPRCFYNWDATGACRQFEVTMPADGDLVAEVMLPLPDRGFWNPEVFLVDPYGNWNDPEHYPTTNLVRMRGEAGLTYLVVLISYGPYPDRLRLNVEVRQ